MLLGEVASSSQGVAKQLRKLSDMADTLPDKKVRTRWRIFGAEQPGGEGNGLEDTSLGSGSGGLR